MIADGTYMFRVSGPKAAVRTAIETKLDAMVTSEKLDLTGANRIKALLLELASAAANATGVVVRGQLYASGSRAGIQIDLEEIEIAS